MAEIYRFFNSVDEDRVYDADDFAEFFAEFLSTGLISRDGEPMIKVTEAGNLKTMMSVGSAIIKGHLYKNTSNITFTHRKGELSRIDRIILRYDNSIENRYIKAFVIEGEESETPSAPALTRNDNIYEISLAQVFIQENGNMTIIDERLDKDVCGIVDSLITVPTSVFEDRYNLFEQNLNKEWMEWFNEQRQIGSMRLLQGELKLIKKNQLETLIDNALNNRSTSMDNGYFFDVFANTDKIDLDQTTAIIEDGMAKIPEGKTSAEIVWKPHDIGFVANKVTHYQTRPIQTLLTLVEDAEEGTNVIKVENVKITITEVE